jgi:serine/threonine protein phosphatase PrpC
VDIAGATHAGRVRTTNEDSFLAMHLADSPDALIAVADGVGGREAGDIASQMAVKTLLRARLRAAHATVADVECETRLREAVQQANLFTFKLNRQLGNADFSTGTTLTVLHLFRDHATLFSIGDSRCYRLRRSRLEVLTHDDTWAQRLVEEKKLRPCDAVRHPLSNTLYRCIGSAPVIPRGFNSLKCSPGDRYAVVTDGVWKVLKPEQVKMALADAGSAKEAVDRLVLASLREGATDNLAACAAIFQ